MWRTSQDLFLQVHNWNSTRGKPYGDRIVSIYVPEGYRYGYRFGTGENVEKKEQFQALHANMNEVVVFQDIARYRFW